MQPREYDQLADALKARHEAEVLAEQKRQRMRRWLRPRVIISLAIVLATLAVGAIATVGLLLGRTNYSMTLMLRDPEGHPIDAKIELAGAAEGTLLPTAALVPTESGAYVTFGKGMIPKSAQYEIRVAHYLPLRFNVADHCYRTHLSYCRDVYFAAQIEPEPLFQALDVTRRMFLALHSRNAVGFAAATDLPFVFATTHQKKDQHCDGTSRDGKERDRLLGCIAGDEKLLMEDLGSNIEWLAEMGDPKHDGRLRRYEAGFGSPELRVRAALLYRSGAMLYAGHILGDGVYHWYVVAIRSGRVVGLALDVSFF